MKRRVLALLLAIVMLIGMLPTGVFADAAEPDESASVQEVEEVREEPEAPEEDAPEEEEPEPVPEEDPQISDEELEEFERLEEEAAFQAASDKTVELYFTVSNQGVIAKTETGDPAIDLSVVVTDLDADGVVTYADAIDALHEDYCSGGYAISGVNVSKFWGNTKNYVMFLRNGAYLEKAVNHESSAVEQGDHLYAAITTAYSDCYTSFDKSDVTVKAGEKFTLKLQGKCEYVASGPIAGVSVGTWADGKFTALDGATTDKDGNVTLSFAKAGTYIVSAKGEVEGEEEDAEWGDSYPVDCTITAPYCIVTVEAAAPAATANVYFTVSNQGVLAQTPEGKDAVELPVTVKDLDNDGFLTYDEALVALHEEYCPGGYEIDGGFVIKLWDVTTEPSGSNLFVRNQKLLPKGVADKTSIVAQDDQLYICVEKDWETYSDAVTYFDSTHLTVNADDEITLNLQGGSTMAKGGFSAGPIAGVQVGTWDSGEFTAIKDAVTDEKGNVTLSFPKAGTYIVSAGGTVKAQIQDWRTGDGTKVITVDAPITAPYCIVTVNPAVITYATVTFNFQEDGGQIAWGFDEKIPSNLAESYGYTDHVKGAVSALDVLVRAHELVFFDQFTPEDAKDFLDIGPTDWIIKYMGEDSTNLTTLVNGKQAADEDGKGLFVNQTKVVDGDYILFGVYQDTAYYLDRYVWLETADGKPLNGQTFLADTDIDLVAMGNYAAYGAEGGPDAAVEGAQLSYMDMTSGEVSAFTGKVSDEDGKLTFHIPEGMANKTVCLLATGDEMFGALAVIKIGNVVKPTDLAEVHVGIGGRTEDTVKELTLSPAFVHDTMDYTVEPLAFVEDEASRYLWVKVEYISYCTADLNFHGVTKTFTEAQNGQWVRLDKLVPGAEASVLTLTSTATDGFDKTYTVTVSMDKGQAILWKTDLEGESLTVGQNSKHILTVEAGVTKDVDPDTVINYQWYVSTTASTKDGKAVEGANEASFVIPADQTGTFYYYVVASSGKLESATSKIMEVTVKAVPKSITIVTDYPYTVLNTTANAAAGVTFVAQHGDSFQLRAVDENGQDTPVTWKVGSSWGGSFDAKTGTYTVSSTSSSYLTAISALDSTVTSGEKAVKVSYYKFTSQNQTASLSTNGQGTRTAMVVAGNAELNGYVNWTYEIPEGVAEVTSNLAEKANRLNMNVLRPGVVKVSMTVDVGPEGAAKLTDSGTVTVTGVAVENAQGGLGKAYLELTGAPTMQLKPYTEEGHTVASWISANEAVATVDDKGFVTAHAVGTTQITAVDDKGTKGGILVVVTDDGNPTFEALELFGITSSTFKYDAGKKEYTGIKLNSYSTSILTIKKDTLYNSDKLDCVATYKNADGEDVSIAVPSATQTQLPGMPFGTTVVTLTLADKENKEIKSVYTLEVTRPRDTNKALGNNSTYTGTKVGLYNAEGGALSSTLYLNQAEGYLFQANEAGVKNSTYTYTNSKYYYRTFLQNGRPDFTAMLKGTSDYTHVRYSVDDGQTWTDLPQGGGMTDVIAIPEAQEGKNAEVKLIVQVVTDQAYFNAGNAYPEMTASKEKLLIPNESGNVTVDGVKYEQVGTIYSFWVEQLPAVTQPRITTATATNGDWYPAFDPEMFTYKLSIPQDGTYPTVTFTVGEGCTVKLGTKAMTADESGNYTLELKSSEQKINVTLGALTQTYSFASNKRIANGADKLVDYLVINSQYTNLAQYGLYGELTLSGSLKSLGNFGGHATYYFEDGLKDDPTNKYGVDFYVDGNAFVDQSTGTGLGSMEPGQVWVSEDGETWYALAGSEHYDGAIWDYTVTYTKDGTGTRWSDNYDNTNVSAKNRTFSWPIASNYFLNDQVKNDTITLSGVLIPSVKGIVGPDDFSTYSSGAKFGYVDAMVNGTDNPYGYNDDYKLKSSGFDLAWAVDTDGNPVDVSDMTFHYVKVVTASNIVAGAANEKSTEVSKVYRATSTGSNVGTTAVPTAITFTQNGYTYTLTPEEGKQVYNVILPMDAVSVHVDTEAENIYVNNQRIAPDASTKEITLKETGATLVRVIVQSGDKEPVIYLLKLVKQANVDENMPQILTQPESAQYLTGDAAQALSVEAQVPGTFQNLTYQWFRNTENSYEGAEAIENAAAASYALGKVEKTGTTYYFCTVTNQLGKDYSVTSDIVEITVKTEEAYLAEHVEGTGTEDDPYQIAKAEDYTVIAGMVNTGHSFAGKYLVQTADITLPENWKPMGVRIDPSINSIQKGKNMYPFSGHLDGNGSTLTVPEGGLPLLGYVQDAYVENLNIYGTRIEGYGLVNNLEGVGLKGNAITIDGVTLKSGTKTLKSGLIGTYITDNGYAGCAGNYLVTIRNCVAEEGVVIGYDGTQSHIGAFAGRFNGTIENCRSDATVKGVDYVGGIVGSLDNAYGVYKITGCDFGGSVEASGTLAGGILGGGYSDPSGYNALRATIQNCTVTGSVTGANMVGGIQGGNTMVVQTFANGPLNITDNKFSGKVTATGGEAVGMIIGYLKGLNGNDNIVGNTCETNVFGLNPIGQVEYVDTSAETHENVIGLHYINTANGIGGLPALSIPWFRWNARLNRTDDLLGADSAKMGNVIGQPRLADAENQMLSGKRITLNVTESGTGSKISAITWTLADPLDSIYATVTPAGVVTAKTVPTIRTVTFVGTLSGEYTGTLTHTVTVLPLATKVEIHQGEEDVTGKTITMNVAEEEGKTLTLKGVAYPGDAQQDVTWKSSNTKILAVDAEGTVTYVKGTGTVTITATANDGSRKAAAVKIQVGNLTTKVTIEEPASKILRGGQSLTLKATTEPEKPTVSGVTFQLADSADSAYVSLNASGKVSAKNVNEPHEVEIVAVSKDAAQVKSDPVTLTILPKADSSIVLKVGNDYVTKTTLVRKAGAEIELKAFAATVIDGDYGEAEASVTWKTSNAKVASVDENGKVTCLKSGSATISALVNGKAQATVTVKVTSLVEKLEITSKTGSFTVASGKSLNLIATVTEPAKPDNKGVVWSITDDDGSEFAKISGSGSLSANKDLTSKHTITVQATAKDGGGASAEATVTILPVAQAISVFAKDHERTTTTLVWDMAADPALEMGAQVYPINASQNVTWTSSNSKIATVDAEGHVTCLKTGSVTITAATTDGSGKKAAFKISVVKLMKNLTLEDASVAGGKTLNVRSVIEPADTTNKKLTWSVSANDYKITVNSSGRLSTKAVTEKTTVTVTATAQDGSGTTASCEVTVYPATTKVTVSTDGQMPKTMAVGEILQLNASCMPENAADVYTWKVSNAKVASVDETGKVTFHAPGSVTVTATAADGTGKSASAKFTVVQLMEDLTLANSNSVLAGGKSLQMVATIAPANTTNKKLTWSVSENTAGITVNASGRLSTKAVTERVEVTVTAEAQDGSGLKAEWQVTVCPATQKVTIVSADSGEIPTTVAIPADRKEADLCLTLKATSDPEDAGWSYAWKTNNKFVTVKDGAVMAESGAIGKTVTITCTAMDGTNKSASVKVKFVAAPTIN